MQVVMAERSKFENGDRVNGEVTSDRPVMTLY